MNKIDVRPMGAHDLDTECEQQMREGFTSTAAMILADAHQYRKTTDTLFVGLEIELPLVTSTFDLSPQNSRDEVIDQFAGRVFSELGAHQIEIINEPPIDLLNDGFGALYELTNSIVSSVLKEVHSRGLQVLRLGCCPLVEIDSVEYTKGDYKYERCPQWHTKHQRRDIAGVIGRTETVRADNAYIVGLMNSVQISVDALNFSDAIDKLNRALMIGPYALAIGANARYIECKDTGICDIRFAGWEMSHDVRSPSEVDSGYPTRIGLPQRYYRSVKDYFEQIKYYPFILDDPISMAHPFDVGLGLCWRDSRLKFFREKRTIAVEFRPISLQPTLWEDVAMMFFFIGRLAWSQYNQESMLPMCLVQANKEQANNHGLNSYLWRQKGGVIEQVSGRDALHDEIDRVVEGMKLLGASYSVIHDMVQVFEQRLIYGSPAEQFATAVQRIENSMSTKKSMGNRRNAIIEAIRELGISVP